MKFRIKPIRDVFEKDLKEDLHHIKKLKFLGFTFNDSMLSSSVCYSIEDFVELRIESVEMLMTFIKDQGEIILKYDKKYPTIIILND